MSLILKTRSRWSTLAGVAVSVALNALVIACLFYGAHTQVVEVPNAVTMVSLAPQAAAAAPRPLATPQPKPVPQPEQHPARVVHAPQATAAPATQGAARNIGTVVPPSYFGELEALIQRTLVYPPHSLATGEEGICIVRVGFSRDGVIHGEELVQDAGHQALDEECREVFRRIGRFPPVPAETTPDAADFSIELPINYSLQ